MKKRLFITLRDIRVSENTDPQGTQTLYGQACDVMVIIVGNGHGEVSSNPGWG